MKTKHSKVIRKNLINGCDHFGSWSHHAESPPVFSTGAGGSAVAGTGSAKSASDAFYDKLVKLFEPSGLSLVLNFREASLDLYSLYKEVIERGGYYEVTKKQRWGEVASRFYLKGDVSMSPDQFQKFYANLLYHFEQLYHYRSSAKAAAAITTTTELDPIGQSFGSGYGLSGKRKEMDDYSHASKIQFGSEDGSPEKKKINISTCQCLVSTGPAAGGHNLYLQTASSNTHEIRKKKKKMKKLKPPLSTRNAYHFFVMKECIRLKNVYGERAESLNLRDMAVDAWRYLSEKDKEPYVEESKKDKERFNHEMEIFTKLVNIYRQGTTPNAASTSGNSNSGKKKLDGGDYHVSLQPYDDDNDDVFVSPDESMVEKTVSLMKAARQDDPIFQVNLDDEYSEST